MNHLMIVNIAMITDMLVKWFQCDATARLLGVVSKYIKEIKDYSARYREQSMKTKPQLFVDVAEHSSLLMILKNWIRWL